jgi:hypothetical protein
MNNESNYNLYKAAIILGVGALLFWVIKPKAASTTSTSNTLPPTKTNADGPAPSKENAEIVVNAYSSALKANEPAGRLTELNKEMMKEFGMRCYLDKDKLTVCDTAGNIILTK